MAASLFAANRGYLDNVEVKRIVNFEKELHAFLEREHLPLIHKINERGDFGDEIQRGLDEALKAFKATGTW
jgi:F-type H+-transporting ATPase subunit alpha